MKLTVPKFFLFTEKEKSRFKNNFRQLKMCRIKKQHKNKETDKKTNKQANKQTNKQTNKQKTKKRIPRCKQLAAKLLVLLARSRLSATKLSTTTSNFFRVSSSSEGRKF